ncbi:MAG: hypothetical protein SGILL_003448 [Bacillariaceae sp.]
MSTSSIEEQRKTAAADLASLARVSHRLALVDTTEKLQAVLDKLLPRLLQRIGDNHQLQMEIKDRQLSEALSKIHLKLVEMLSHTMKRVRHDRNCKLNAVAIVQLLVTEEDGDGKSRLLQAKDNMDSFSLNLSLTFLTLTVPRCSVGELEQILPGLLVLHAAYEQKVDAELSNGDASTTTTSSTKKQWHQVSHLLLSTLERLIAEEEASMKEQQTKKNANKRIKTSPEEKKQEKEEPDEPQQPSGLEKARQVILNNPSVAASTYDLLLDALLYSTQVGNVPPGGLSSVGWERLKDGYSEKEKDWQAEMAPLNRLAQFKTRLIEWAAPSRRWGLFLVDNPNESDDNKSLSEESILGISRTLTLLTVASGDPMKSVAEEAKQYLKQYFDLKSNTKGFGDADRFSKELLSLSVGKINAVSVLPSSVSTTSTEDRNGLGLYRAGVTCQRRQVSETHYAEMVGMATKAFDDTTDNGIVDMGKLVILSSDKMLSKLTNAVGLNNQRGKPFVLAAEQLSALVMRLEKCKTQHLKIFNLDARALTLAVKVLTPIGATKVTSSSNAVSESHVSVRDSIYGCLSTLSRSSFATEKFFCLMAVGDMQTAVLSVDLLHLLLRCVGNEVDRLRPRATAALDALLFACRRVTEMEEQDDAQDQATPDANPWSTTATQSKTPVASGADLPSQLAKFVLPLLWNASRSSQPRQSRVAASRWASDLMITIDAANATHILCYLAGDADVTAAAIARDGLDLGKEKEANVADFGEICSLILSDGDGVNSRPTYWDFSHNGKSTAVKCLLRCFLDDFHGDESGTLQSFMGILAETLSRKEEMIDRDLQDTCAEAFSVCIGVSRDARTMIASSSLHLGIRDLRDLVLSSTSSRARRFHAEAFGKFMEDKDVLDPSEWSNVVIETTQTTFERLKVQPLKPGTETHGACLLGGTIVNLLCKYPSEVQSVSLAFASQILVNLGEGLLHTDDTVGNVCSDGILLACQQDGCTVLPDSLIPGMTVALSKLGLGLTKFGNGDRASAPRVLKLIEPAGHAIAVVITSQRPETSIQTAQSECVDAIFKLLGSDAFRKDEEIALSAGEALATFASAYRSDNVLIEGSMNEWPDDMDVDFSRALPPPAQILYTLLRTTKTTNNNHKRRACAAALLAVVARATSLEPRNALRDWVLQCINEVQDCFLFLLVDGKSSQLSRESCCLGLVALNKLVGKTDDSLKSRLLRSVGQTTNYGGSAMQETAQQADRRRAQEQVNAQGGNGANNDAMEVSPSVDVGGAAGVSEASLGAYVEMASAAVACGHPEILYSMLLLSVSHPVWSGTASRRDRYGPSTLQGESFDQDKMKTALRPFLSRLLPRILRACHDPNKETREQMQTLWNALTGGGEEGRSAINSFFRSTFDALIVETSSKLWRTRVGACGALAQIITGRSWQDLGGGPAVLDENYDLVISQTPSESTSAGVRLLRLWRACLRALDDVRITVREGGEALGRGVRALTVRLCNPSPEKKDQTDISPIELERDAAAAAATSLRFLLKTGLKQQAAEAAGICISTLIGIIDCTTKPAILEPLLSDVIFALLVAMSNLEPAAFNYLAVRQDSSSDAYEDLARLRLQASQSSVLAEAVRKCIDLVPALRNSRYQEAVVGAIESAMRKSTGIATRSACADCVITLTHSTPNMFRSNSASSSLLRCFSDSVFRERGGKVVQGKMNSAFGALCALCSGSDVKKLTVSAADKYRRAHGNHDDVAMRHAAALVLRSIAVKAPNHISDQLNVWCTNILPVSYLAMKEPNSADAALWKEIWEDGGAVVSQELNDSDENTVEGKLLLSLVKECVNGLGDLAFVRRVSAAEALSDLTNRGILAPPPRQLDGNVPPAIQRRAQRRAKATRTGLSALVRLIAKSRVWSGKGDIIKAAAVLAIPWMEVTKEEAAVCLLGDAASAPVAFEETSAETDLFVGDKWFEQIMDSGEDGDDNDEEKMAESDNDATMQDEDGSSMEDDARISVLGLCRLFLSQSFPSKPALRSITDEEVLPFRSGVLQALDMLSQALPTPKMKEAAFAFSAPQLFEVFGNLETKESPLIVARSLSCFAAMLWTEMDFEGNEEYLESSKLLELFLYHVDYGKQSAWTVREAAAKAAAKCALCADTATLRKRQYIAHLIDIAALGVRDKKFWKVRLASLEILLSLTTKDKELVLPYKESIQDLAKKSLRDPEAQITALSTKVLGVLSTWP